jgi:methionyl-tRNA formyltransferase
MSELRIVFMGSPEFALPTLRALSQHYQVCGVVTQPDRPSGRGNRLTPPPVKALAQELGLPIIQPGRMKEPGVFEQIQSWEPDLIVVAAFGQILRQHVLDLPRLGCINVHASLLPRWRGASPIYASVLAGDITTGVTIMKMDAGIDTGDILTQQSMVIQSDDTTETLSNRLADLGAALLIETLPEYIDGRIRPKPQDELIATYAPILKKEDGLLDFSKPAETLERQVRACQPWPGAYLEWKGELIKVSKAAVLPQSIAVGSRTIHKKLPVIGTASGGLVLLEVQPPGKRPMSGRDFLNGTRDWLDN